MSRKGGTGKTTLALHLAVEAIAARKSVLVADSDRQRSAVAWRRQRSAPEPPVLECKPGALFALQQAVERGGGDLMVVDTSPASDFDNEQAARCADLCIVVLRPSFFDVRAISETVETIRRLNRRGLLVVNQAPPARVDREGTAVREALAQLRDFGLPIASVGLRQRAVYQRAIARGLTARELEPDGQAAAEVARLWQDVEARLWG